MVSDERTAVAAAAAQCEDDGPLHTGVKNRHAALAIQHEHMHVNVPDILHGCLI